jgi:hypothetical protein
MLTARDPGHEAGAWWLTLPVSPSRSTTASGATATAAWLAYLYLLGDGRPPLFVNARLVAAGYARTLSIPPNTAHATELAALERTAALAGRGLWSSCG